MASENQVTIVGNLTDDPELRYTPNGAAVVKFRVAVNRRYKTATGEDKEEVTFVDCTAFGRTGEGWFDAHAMLMLFRKALREDPASNVAAPTAS